MGKPAIPTFEALHAGEDEGYDIARQDAVDAAQDERQAMENERLMQQINDEVPE